MALPPQILYNRQICHLRFLQLKFPPYISNSLQLSLSNKSYKPFDKTQFSPLHFYLPRSSGFCNHKYQDSTFHKGLPSSLTTTSAFLYFALTMKKKKGNPMSSSPLCRNQFRNTKCQRLKELVAKTKDQGKKPFRILQFLRHTQSPQYNGFNDQINNYCIHFDSSYFTFQIPKSNPSHIETLLIKTSPVTKLL